MNKISDIQYHPVENPSVPSLYRQEQFDPSPSLAYCDCVYAKECISLKNGQHHPPCRLKLRRLSLLCLLSTALPVCLYNCRQSRRGEVRWGVSRRRGCAVRSVRIYSYNLWFSRFLGVRKESVQPNTILYGNGQKLPTVKANIIQNI